jgi:flavin reductase (DIM6/NTAB) family NADH-FMN oxidoreductase RutF
MKRDNKTGTAKKSLPLSKVYRPIEPGPVVLVTTAGKGKADIMALSWHMMIDFEPPLVVAETLRVAGPTSSRPLL